MKAVKRHSIKKQMLILNSSLILFTVLLISLIAVFSYTSLNQNNTTALSEQLVSRVVQNINYYTLNLKSIANAARYDLYIQKFSFGPIYSVSEKYETVTEIQKFFENIVRTNEDISNILYISDYGTVLSEGNLNPNYRFTAQPWYTELSGSTSGIMLKPHKQSYIKNSQALVLSYVSKINRFDTDKISGVILIDFSLDALKKIVAEISVGESGYLMIVDESANVIYHPDYSYMYRSWDEMYIKEVFKADDPIIAEAISSRETSFKMNVDQRNLLITRQAVGDLGWTVIGVYPQDELLTRQTTITLLIVGIGLLIAIVGFFLTLLVSGLIFNPLWELQLKMKQPELKKAPLGVYSPDEMGDLNQSYDAMLLQIQSLMSEVVGKEKQKRKAELRALQSQINPHFLYNTLDSIVWMAESNSKLAAVMTESLARLFRLSLSKGREVITVEEEIEHVKNYLIIQEMRYEDKFNYKIDVDPDILKYNTLKLILQPIAENAIYHGIKNKRYKGNLLIKGRLIPGGIVFQIMDDGVGIPENKLNTILTSDSLTSQGFSGVGMKNVNERIKLYYGQEYGLEIYSVEGVGTVVDISIPIRPEEDSDD